MKKMIKKVIAPVLVITVLFAVLRTFCIQDGEVQLFLAVTSDGDTVWNRKNVCLDGSKRF